MTRTFKFDDTLENGPPTVRSSRRRKMVPAIARATNFSFVVIILLTVCLSHQIHEILNCITEIFKSYLYIKLVNKTEVNVYCRVKGSKHFKICLKFYY